MDAMKDAMEFTKTGTAKFRRAEIRKAMRGDLPLIEVKDEKGEITGTVKPVYVSHTTSIPPVMYVRDTRFRRHGTPWRKRKEDRATTVITCKLVPVEA